MAIDPEELAPRKAKPEIAIGEDLSTFSVFELEGRIAALESEIARTKLSLEARANTKNAADSFFKR
jgi:uncharacterized small protein (DUF1192 family)